MARLSSPEVALQQIGNVYHKIDELHEVVDFIKTIGNKADESYGVIHQYETRLKTKIAEFKKLETVYEEAAAKVEEFGKDAGENIRRIISEFDQEKIKIDETLQSLYTERKEVEDLRGSLEAEISQINQNVSAKTLNFTTQLERLIGDSQQNIAQAVEESKTIIHQELDRIASFMMNAQQELTQLTHVLENFKEHIANEFNTKAEEISKQQAAFQESANRELSSRLSEDSRQLKASAKKEIQAVVSFFDQEKSKITETLQHLQAERKDLDTLRQILDNELSQLNQNFTSQMAQFSTQLESASSDSQRQLSQSIKEGKTLIEEKLNRLIAFADNSKQELDAQKNSLESFRLQITNDYTAAIESMTGKQKSFQETTSEQLTSLFSKNIKQLQEVVENEIQRLMSEHNQQKLTINETMQSLLKERKELDAFAQAIEAGKTIIDGKLNQLSSFTEQSANEFHELKAGLETFKDSIRGDIQLKIEEWSDQQNTFEQTINKKISSKFIEESEQLRLIRESLEKAIQNAASGFERQKSELNKLFQSVESEKANIDEKLNQAKSFIDSSKEEFQDIKNNLDMFQTGFREDFQKQMESLSKQQTTFQQTVNKEVSSKFSYESEQFRLIRATLDKAIQNTTAEFDMQKEELQRLSQSIAAGKTIIDDKIVLIDDKIKELNSVTEHTKEALSDKLSQSIEAGKTIIDDKIVLIDDKIKELNSVTEHTKEALSDKLSQAIEAGKTIIDDKIKEMVSASEHINEEFHELKFGIQGFKDSIQTDIQNRLKDVFNQQQNFEASITDEISVKFSEETRQLQTVLIASHTGQKEEIEKIRNAFDNSILEIKQKLNNKITDFTSVLKKVTLGVQQRIAQSDDKSKLLEEKSNQMLSSMEDSKKEIFQTIQNYQDRIQANEQANHHIEDKLNQFVSSMEDSKNEIFHTIQSYQDRIQANEQTNHHIEDKLNQFVSSMEDSKNEIFHTIQSYQDRIQANEQTNHHIEDKLNQFVSSTEDSKKEIFHTIQNYQDKIQANEQANHQIEDKLNQLTIALDATVSKESEQKGQQDALTAKIDEGFGRQTALINGVSNKIGTLEHQLSGIQKEHNEAQLEQRKIDAKFSDFIKRLVQMQHEQKAMLSEFEKRITALEGKN